MKPSSREGGKGIGKASSQLETRLDKTAEDAATLVKQLQASKLAMEAEMAKERKLELELSDTVRRSQALKQDLEWLKAENSNQKEANDELSQLNQTLQANVDELSHTVQELTNRLEKEVDVRVDAVRGAKKGKDAHQAHIEALQRSLGEQHAKELDAKDKVTPTGSLSHRNRID